MYIRVSVVLQTKTGGHIKSYFIIDTHQWVKRISTGKRAFTIQTRRIPFGFPFIQFTYV